MTYSIFVFVFFLKYKMKRILSKRRDRESRKSANIEDDSLGKCKMIPFTAAKLKTLIVTVYLALNINSYSVVSIIIFKPEEL